VDHQQGRSRMHFRGSIRPGLEGTGTSGYRGKYPRVDLSSSLMANSWNSAMVAQILVVQPCAHRSGHGRSVGPKNPFRPSGPSQLGHGYFTVQISRSWAQPPTRERISQRDAFWRGRSRSLAGGDASIPTTRSAASVALARASDPANPPCAQAGTSSGTVESIFRSRKSSGHVAERPPLATERDGDGALDDRDRDVGTRIRAERRR
jgi:hypothetical protein